MIQDVSSIVYLIDKPSISLAQRRHDNVRCADMLSLGGSLFETTSISVDQFNDQISSCLILNPKYLSQPLACLKKTDQCDKIVIYHMILPKGGKALSGTNKTYH
jgi:hypothetical protein